MRRAVIALLIAFTVFLSGCISEEVSFEGEKEETWVSDVRPASGPGIPPPGVKEDGPWNHRLLIATSDDGIEWNKTSRILADQASVPDVIVDNEGYVRSG